MSESDIYCGICKNTTWYIGDRGSIDCAECNTAFEHGAIQLCNNVRDFAATRQATATTAKCGFCDQALEIRCRLDSHEIKTKCKKCSKENDWDLK